MRILHELLINTSIIALRGNTDVAIYNITMDSRKVLPNSLFIAIKGSTTDGHDYIERAIEHGATAILCKTFPDCTPDHITYIQVPDAAKEMGQIASNFYGDPSKKVKLVGVTGTNGKTSVATLLFRLFRFLGYHCGLLSTIQNEIDDLVIPATHTTPDAITTNRLLVKMLEHGCTHVFMEVSSHAVVQERISGLHFTGGIFTNITHDHLDFHKNFENYITAKKAFFDQLPPNAFALINADDKQGFMMIQNTPALKYSYSLKDQATFKGKLIADSIFGLELAIDEKSVLFKLSGQFNAYNLLAVHGAAVLLGEDSIKILNYLSGLMPPQGRFEKVISNDRIVGIVDYAHTPDALKNVLETIVGFDHTGESSYQSQVITVIGCGGNRDTTKRPLMAQIACKYSNHVILTSDNPRNEDPMEILKQMHVGVPNTNYWKVSVISDRREAIKTAVRLSKPLDVILVAGKGHETYQEIKGIRFEFSDQQELKNAFQDRSALASDTLVS